MKGLLIFISFVAVAVARKGCGRHEHYDSCGTSCPLTCENYSNEPLVCDEMCNQGCFCDKGFVRADDGQCVRPKKCPANAGDLIQRSCLEKPDSGACDAYFPMWYYDVKTQTCKKFVYGGCDGNSNKHETEEECMNYCKEEKRTRVIGVVGGAADLECNVDVSNCGKVYFITWTKKVSNGWKRLYLFSDAVNKPLQDLANPRRADFYLQESSAYLTIQPLRIEDAGTYKCDVTYVQRKCPSLYSLSFATLITHGCGRHEHFDSCGTSCPLTCENYRNEPLVCDKMCNQGCFCDKGFVRADDGQCVTPKKCPAKAGDLIQRSCLEEPDTGDCDAYFPMWYYDVKTESCKKFVYGGCEGNSNKHETEEECMNYCKDIKMKQSDSTVCSMPVHAGICHAYLIRFYYDKEAGECRQFIYGGCGGNQNNFNTMEECKLVCE